MRGWVGRKGARGPVPSCLPTHVPCCPCACLALSTACPLLLLLLPPPVQQKMDDELAQEDEDDEAQVTSITDHPCPEGHKPVLTPLYYGAHICTTPPYTKGHKPVLHTPVLRSTNLYYTPLYYGAQICTTHPCTKGHKPVLHTHALCSTKPALHTPTCMCTCLHMHACTHKVVTTWHKPGEDSPARMHTRLHTHARMRNVRTTCPAPLTTFPAPLLRPPTRPPGHE